MNQFHPLAGTGEDNPVFADHIAAAKDRETDGPFRPGTRVALANKDSMVVQVDSRPSATASPSIRPCRRARQPMAVMHFHYLDIVVDA